MNLCGLHHITMITGDAQRNVSFYGDVLGLRLVKKTVNFDAPTAYHLYFGDEQGTPGSILTWFEFPGAPRGRSGAGMIHTIRLGVRSPASLDFWVQRLTAAGYDAVRGANGVRFADYDGLRFELEVVTGANPPLAAQHPAVPLEYAIVDLVGARAYARSAADPQPFLTDTLGFAAVDNRQLELDGELRGFQWSYGEPPAEPGIEGAGSVHHIAWASPADDHLAWQERVRQTGTSVTEIRDRDYFRSIYFREPHGILFEIATLSPGFAVDEDPEHLGEALKLPEMHEHLRAQLDGLLAPIVSPRERRRTDAG